MTEPGEYGTYWVRGPDGRWSVATWGPRGWDRALAAGVEWQGPLDISDGRGRRWGYARSRMATYHVRVTGIVAKRPVVGVYEAETKCISDAVFEAVSLARSELEPGEVLEILGIDATRLDRPTE